MTRITRTYPWLARARPLVALLPLALALLLTACGGGSGSSGGSGY
jgi:hypothetical protein